MTGGSPRPRLHPRLRLRPDRIWRLRQLSGALFVLWFAVAVPLTALTLAVEPRWVGWVVVAWFLVLVAFMVAVRVAEARRRRAWAGVVQELGWDSRATAPELVRDWPFPPFTYDPDAEVLDVTAGRHRGREFATGRFRYVASRRQLGFDFLDLEVERPLPPLQVLPDSLTSLASPGQHPPELLPTADGQASYRLLHGQQELALAVLHPRAMTALAGVPSFGFTCQGRRFVAMLPSYRDPGTALTQLDAACDLLDLMPEHVWQAGEQWAATRS